MEFTQTHGWQVVFIVGFQQEGYPNKIIVDRDTKESCELLISDLSLTKIN
jgi:hypothetical protein